MSSIYHTFFVLGLTALIGIQSNDEQLAMIKSSDSALPVIRSSIEKRTFQEKKTIRICVFGSYGFFSTDKE